MNIKRAKQEIKNALRAYLAKDEFGAWRIPPIRQRPVLLIGPPGHRQDPDHAADRGGDRRGTGFLYADPPHAPVRARPAVYRKGAARRRGAHGDELHDERDHRIGLPRDRAAPGVSEGILFLDEINCISETLTPMMLQFLQCKTFGNQQLPAGWMVVAAGNPPEYNKSVREFDVVTLDRVKKIDIEEDFGVWKEYAGKRGSRRDPVLSGDPPRQFLPRRGDGGRFAVCYCTWLGGSVRADADL